MKEKIITLCGDSCLDCPRYNAHSAEELNAVANLWYKVGWRDRVVSNEEIRCGGCSSHKECPYRLIECIDEHNVEKCNQCAAFPCTKISDMLKKADDYRKTCKEVCSATEFEILEKAFFEKEKNLNEL